MSTSDTPLKNRLVFIFIQRAQWSKRGISHFVVVFYHSHDTTITDAVPTIFLMKSLFAEVREILSTALGSASESPAIIEEV
jgi:hypothetical protein